VYVSPLNWVFYRIHIFNVLNQLKQICNFAKGSNESSKTEALIDIVEAVKSNNEKILIFSQYLPREL